MPDEPKPERLTYSVAEAAKLLGMSTAVAYERTRTGELPSIRIGSRILIPRRRLEKLLGVSAEEDGPPEHSLSRDDGEQLRPRSP
jgi:excisionase family DNA binding protein